MSTVVRRKVKIGGKRTLDWLRETKVPLDQHDGGDDASPIRSEIFGEDKLREHGISLAKSHAVTKDGVAYRYVRYSLKHNLEILSVTYAAMREAVHANDVIAPAGEWLVDNFHVIEQHVHQALEDMPSGYYRQLPKVETGHLAGEPRVMGIAWAYIAHTDSSFHERTLVDFVNAYQTIHALTIGELWAVAIHLRILLVENATRVAQRTVISRKARSDADEFSIRVLNGSLHISSLSGVLNTFPLHAQVSYLLQLMRNVRAARQPNSELAERINRLLIERGFDYDSASADERARQVANNLTMRNVFVSLKAIAELDWEAWFQNVSKVDDILSAHQTYHGLDPDSRSMYRRAVEDLAINSGKDETFIATLASRLAKHNDAGYALIGPGREELERECAYDTSALRKMGRVFKSSGIAGYVGLALLVAAVIIYIASGTVLDATVGIHAAIILLCLIFFPAFDAATTMINVALGQLLRPLVLPGYSLDKGVPESAKTLIAVPTLLTSLHNIEALVERLELHYMSSDDPNIHLALVTDWKDASSEIIEGDTTLLKALQTAIHKLNQRHGQQRFYALHRHRLYNTAQGVWMGWERKRGKLHELNRLLRGATDTSFVNVPSNLPEDFQYVIVLDSDTILPRDAAKRMIGKMSHPLNAPYFDPACGRVTRGYGILQPRVTMSFPETAEGSVFQKIFVTRPGLDPYVSASSDVYQDLFGEGSFTGKGIYHVDAFEQALAGRIRENTILSHDLLEGNLARAGLVTDIELVEDFPESYLVDAARHHRWTRGDWQLLPWLRPSTRGITVVGWWKMFDNLRRSINPLITLLTLLLGWIILDSGTAVSWTLFVTLLIFIPAFLPIFSGSTWRNEPVAISNQLKNFTKELLSAVQVTAARITFLVHEASFRLDAALRALFRISVSRRNLLEWTTAAQMQSSLRPDWIRTNVMMIASIALGLTIVAAATMQPPPISPISVVFGILWIVAPSAAFFASQPPKAHADMALDDADLEYLRKTALHTWRYFDTFVTATNNMLPPDNFQEDLKHGEAQRTSPTNIGLYLLSTVSAFDLGWIGLADAVSRLDATLATVARMDKYRGHIYNWYDTRDLRPLEPKYVSTVDSGNLAGHLIAIANACELWMREPVLGSKRMQGIGDLLHVLSDLAKLTSDSYRSAEKATAEVNSNIAVIGKVLMDMKQQPERLPLTVLGLKVQVNALEKSALILWSENHALGSDDAEYWLNKLKVTVTELVDEVMSTPDHQVQLMEHLRRIAQNCRSIAYSMDFNFLLNTKRKLLSIGYSRDNDSLDESCYDLLASEAVLASLFAIAKQDVDVRHWSRLGRPVVAVNGAGCLVSWSGSMFEYLMPHIVFANPAGSLLRQTLQLVVRKQIRYAQSLALPWGISESAYAARDRQSTYQYSNFGVPGLGLKRGLADNLVIAPYASALAAMIRPKEAVVNLQRLNQLGGQGRYGFYESIDFTQSRLRKGQSHEVIKAYFAHHQGMTITAIHNVISAGRLREYFQNETTIKSVSLLLQERAPSQLPIALTGVKEMRRNKPAEKPSIDAARHLDPTVLNEPVSHLLSNGRLVSMINAEGGGYMRWNGIAINRWRNDPTIDDDGLVILLREGKSRILRAVTGRVTPVQSTRTILTDEKAEFISNDGNVTSRIECFVAIEDDAEARCIELINSSSISRELEFTTYLELALAHPDADASHPAFSKLFVETQYIPEHNALIATRRKRQQTEPDIWVAQMIVNEGTVAGSPEYDTSRESFLGRGNPVWQAQALRPGTKLQKNTGSVLDPIFAFRQSVTVRPHGKSRSVLWTLVADSRLSLMEKISRYSTYSVFERLQVQAWTQARILLRHLAMDETEASAFQNLASRLIYSSPLLRPSARQLSQHMGSQASMWALAISGNKPVIVLRVRENAEVPVVIQLLRAQNYWHEKCLSVDVVILNDEPTSYLQDLHGTLNFLLEKERNARGSSWQPRQGELFLLRSEAVVPHVRDALLAMAHVVLDAAKGPLQTQQTMWSQPLTRQRQHVSIGASLRGSAVDDQVEAKNNLQFFNGYGGFSESGDEYHVLHRLDSPLPAPWINVIANERFGTHCSAEGGGYSWFRNSKEKQLTVWSNDAVADRPSEVFYVKDLDNGLISSPCVEPIGRRPGIFKTVHGFGFTRFSGVENDLRLEVEHVVATDDPVKMMRLRITNSSTQSRRFAVTFYAEIVLGQGRAATAHYMTTSHDQDCGALFARNVWSSDIGQTVLFADMSGRQSSWTGDRTDFLGYRGQLGAPQAVVTGGALNGSVGGGHDPCIAVQLIVSLAAGATDDIVMSFGAGENVQRAQDLVKKYGQTDFDEFIASARKKWSDLLHVVTVETPDPAFNVMMNGWLMYQTISCRMWGRAGFYQASGAYGFRDQLQDSLTIAHVLPSVARQHLLKAAARQFVEGDVQHWWLPETGAGVRTHISDDTVWLAFCTAYYVRLTGDASVLDEQVTYIEGRKLEPGEHDAFYVPEVSQQTASLYEHCVAALTTNFTTGENGLPLMGTGDWNDGMNRVGEHGKGESVWLGWFLCATLKQFEEIASLRSDKRRNEWAAKRKSLATSLEKNAWDGAWYRRAYFDDGTPLGTHDANECRIDAIAQSWSVLSGMAAPERARMAMASADTLLIDRVAGIARLFTPPLQHHTPNAGYVQSYPPGIRENGGQYTHGALWAIFAFAELRETEKTFDLFALINPVNHSLARDKAEQYKTEPYVIAADVYGAGEHTGRGGWTWYTGAAGWAYRAGLEAILGIRREGNLLYISPCVPQSWPSMRIRYLVDGKHLELHFNRFDQKMLKSEVKSPKKIDLTKFEDGAIILVEFL